MTVKQDPVEIGSTFLIEQCVRSPYSFEDYCNKVMRMSRVKLKRINVDLKPVE
jgi:hypothetical protein